MILNYRNYGENVLGLRWPFTEAEVKEEMALIEKIAYEKRERSKSGSGRTPPPKAIELSGVEFVVFCDKFRTLSREEFQECRDQLYRDKL